MKIGCFDGDEGRRSSRLRGRDFACMTLSSRARGRDDAGPPRVDQKAGVPNQTTLGKAINPRGGRFIATDNGTWCAHHTHTWNFFWNFFGGD